MLDADCGARCNAGIHVFRWSGGVANAIETKWKPNRRHIFGLGALDPHQGTSFSHSGLTAAIFDSLMELDPKGRPVPGIAERWEISNDGLSHTFYIRKGVKFHDGSDLTGEDVKFSIDRLVGPKSIQSSVADWRATVAGTDLKDQNTVVIRMKAPRFDLLTGFENLGGGPVVLPRKYIEEKGDDYFAQHPIGSGPWKAVKWEPGNSLNLEAVESHWRAVPKFKNIKLVNVTEESTKVAMLKTGELDLAGVATDSVKDLKSAGLTIQKHDGHAQTFLFPFYDVDNPQKWAFGDVRVRKALSLAINRQEMADTLYSGYARPSAAWYVPKTAFFWEDGLIKPDPYDPEQAKKLLTDAGYSSGFNTKIWDRRGGFNDTAYNLAIGGYWRKIGINADVVPMEYTALRPMWYPKHKPEIWGTVNGSVSGGSVFQFEKMVTAYHSRGEPKNVKNPRLDELIDKVPMTKDPVEKKKLAQEAVRLAKDEYSVLGINDLDTVFAYGSKIGGFTPTEGLSYIANALETITHGK